jgi:acetylornithine deacetylase/succinyl-diaminopimelate desuccinylase-like protein
MLVGGSPARLADGRPGLGLGFKGALAIRLDLRLLATDAHSATAAIVPSAAWRLVQALSTLRSPDGSILIDGFYDDVLATSKAEHAAIAEAGDAFEEGIRQALEIEAFIDDLKGAELRERASFAPTCNIAGIKTGYSGPGTKTVLPAEANAWLDLRLVPDQRPEKALELLRRHLEREGFADIEVDVIGMASPAGTPIDHPFVERVARVAHEVADAPASITPIVAGTLPIVSSLQDPLGVPGLAAPDNPFAIDSKTHAPNENVRVENVGHAVRFTHALFTQLADAG